jgi:transposase
MRPEAWNPPVAPSAAEEAVIKAVRRAKLFVFLRLHRHELFDELFQSELAIPRTAPKPVLARMLGALLVFQGGGTY